MSELDPQRTVVVANPASRGGWVSREWDSLTSQVRQVLGDVQFEQTKASGDASDIAKRSVDQGAETIISLGGDGTHGEVADGIARSDGNASLGILHAGTGGDFRRTLQSADDLSEACAVIQRATPVPCDLGRVTYVGDDGAAESRHFLNLASVGMAGMIDRIVSGSSRHLGGRATYAVATLKGSMRYRPSRVALTIDGTPRGEFTIANLCVCNGRYAGGGMMFAPRARLCDGLLDIIVIESASTLRSLPVFVGLYRGTHIHSRLVHVFRGAEVEVTPLNADPAWMDIDGEAPGVAPATFTVLPGALPILGVPADVQ